jgi:hypothetical protein
VERSYRSFDESTAIFSDRSTEIPECDPALITEKDEGESRKELLTRLLAATGALQMMNDSLLGLVTFSRKEHSCCVCSKAEASGVTLLRCSRCKSVWYCTREHQ